MPNPYSELKKELELEEAKKVNPYRSLRDLGGDVVGSKLEPITEPTMYRRINDSRAAAEIAAKESEKANSIRHMAWETIKGTPKAAFDIAKMTVTHPIQTGNQMALGLANGLSFGATDWLIRKNYIKAAEEAGFDEEAARSLAEKWMKPEDPTLAGIRGGWNFAGMVAPYALAEKVVYKGLAYAAPTFVAKHAKAAKLLADLGIFNAVGQVEESFKPEDERNRGMRALIDTGAAFTFFGGGEIFRRMRNTSFKSPFSVAPVTPKNPPMVIPKPTAQKYGIGESVEQVKNGIFHSEAFPIDDAIRSGDIATEKVYKDATKKILTPEFAAGRIDDVASKLEVFSPGLGDTFRQTVKAGETTYDDILKKGASTLDDFVKATGQNKSLGELHVYKWSQSQKDSLYNTYLNISKEHGQTGTMGAGNYYAYDPQSSKLFGDTMREYLGPKGIKILDVTAGTHPGDEAARMADYLIKHPMYREMLKSGETDMMKYAASKGYGGVKFFSDDGSHYWLVLQEGMKLDPLAHPSVAALAQSEAKANLPILTAQLSADDFGRAATDKMVSVTIGKGGAVAPGKGGLAKVAVEGGEKAGAEGAEAGAKAATEEVTVATNNLDSLQSFIKGSGDIEYRVVPGKNLGTDSSGRLIMARHEFNPTTGKHIIYATDNATASTLAHELGHYFDKSLTQSTSGLARLLPNFEKNREGIEDALGSFAVSRLGGNATTQSISAEVRSISDNIVSEARILSGVRQGGAAQSRPSEAFADAVSEILTNVNAARQAPTLTGLLKHLDSVNESSIFGKSMGEQIKGAKFATTEVVEEGGKRITKTTVATSKVSLPELSIPKELEASRALIEKADAKIQRIANKFNSTEGGVNIVRNAEASFSTQEKNIASVVEGIRKENPEMAAKVGKFLNERLEQARAGVDTYKDAIAGKVKAVKEGGPGAIIEKEVARKMERTPTGKKPDTPDIRTDKITADKETEAFFNEKIMPKVTGKERIGKSNEDILTRSFNSNMTEKDFDNILTERFGNMSEDIIKGKRMINDRALAISDKLAGRELDDIPASELGEITNEMNQLVEMFEVMAGIRTELSNSFRSLGVSVAPGENDVLRQVVGEIKRVIGKDVSPFELTKKMVKLRESTIVDKYFSIWYPAILSGPKTTTRNIVGTGSSLITDTVSQLFSKEGRLTFQARLSAIVGSQKQAWENARAVFKGDQTIISKFREGPPMKDEVFKGKFAILNKVEYVGRFLDAQDTFFSTIAREGEVAALRAGEYTYGIESKAVYEKINEGVAAAFAQRITYRNAFDNTAVGTIGRAVTTLKASDNQFVKATFNFIMPFVRTVANVTDRKLDYVPIINLARTFGGKFSEQRAQAVARNIDLKGMLLKDAMERGMGRDEARRFVTAESARVTEIIAQRLKHQQMGKFYMGMTVSAGLIPMAMAGRITGAGPKDKNERDTLMQQGWRPNSIILPGGVVLPYNNLGPLAGVLSMAGNIHDGVKYGNSDEDGVNSMFWSGIQNFIRGELDQSFVSGISGIYDALYGFKEFDQLLSEMAVNAIPIPAAWTQTVSIFNSKQFEANGFLDQMQKKLGVTAGLEPKLNAFGEQYSADLIWGLTPSLLNTEDPVYNWMAENSVFVGKPQKATKIEGRRGEEREMTPEEYTAYLEATGPSIYRELDNKIKSGYFKRFKTEEEKKAAVSKIVSEIREQEKRKFKY